MYNLLHIQFFQLNPFATRDWIKDKCTIESSVNRSVILGIKVGLDSTLCSLNNAIGNICNGVPNWSARFTKVNSKNKVSSFDKAGCIITLLRDNVRSPHHKFVIDGVSLIGRKTSTHALIPNKVVIKRKLSSVFDNIINAHNRFGHNLSVKGNHFVRIPLLRDRFFLATCKKNDEDNK